jgi:hypothetical protein
MLVELINISIDLENLYNEGALNEYFYAFCSLQKDKINKLETYCKENELPVAVVPRGDLGFNSVDIEIHCYRN